jgi:hypothetical protein
MIRRINARVKPINSLKGITIIVSLVRNPIIMGNAVKNNKKGHRIFLR